MKKSLYFIIILIFSSCSNNINENTLVGTWNYSESLFLKEQEIIKSPRADLSQIFQTIKMIFSNTDFTSYLDNQVTIGKWKIENDSLYMFLDNHGWNKYAYKLTDNDLVIYDREYIIALKREK